jgi:hypothetical protein
MRRKTPAPMSVQPSEHRSSVPTQSLPRLPGASSKNVAPCQKTREPNVEEIRAARVREGMRLDALEKQRSAMRR